MALRYLTNPELAIAKPVFRDSLPWNRIRISSRLGFEETEYTWGRTLNVGPYMHKGLDSDRNGRKLLIHELTHVWQYEHRNYGGSYILDAATAHVIHGQKAYVYEAGRPWNAYGAEQQAKIVEDWYSGRKNEDASDPLFRYIREIIRAKWIDPSDQSDAAPFLSNRQRDGF